MVKINSQYNKNVNKVRWHERFDKNFDAVFCEVLSKLTSEEKRKAWASAFCAHCRDDEAALRTWNGSLGDLLVVANKWIQTTSKEPILISVSDLRRAFNRQL